MDTSKWTVRFRWGRWLAWPPLVASTSLSFRTWREAYEYALTQARQEAR